MAERRMFTKKITDGDAFISMSSAAQALYMHLNLGADDDGFNDQIQIAMQKAHASSDDLKILVAKNFVIGFQNGVIVIRHWRKHNLLRKDRYKPTDFQEEYKQLGVKENGEYELGCQLVANWLPQDSKGKYSIGKDSIEEEKECAGACAPTHEDEGNTSDENDILREQFVCGVPLFISNNQVKDLHKKLTTDELEHYSRRILGLMAENYTFTTSHYNFILSVWRKERTVKK